MRTSSRKQPCTETAAAGMVRWPAEWEPHESTLIAWPANRADWPGKFVPVVWVYTEIVRSLIAGERVRILAVSEDHVLRAKAALRRAGALSDAVTFHVLATDRSWMRDSSPFFVYDDAGQRACVGFAFNGWAKYDNWRADAKVPAFLAKALKLPLRRAEQAGRTIVLEGGAVDVNGAGVMLATEECLLDPAVQVRNPGFTAEDYAEAFRRHLGIEQVIWLGAGIAGDDTHGHVDDLCRFVGRNTVVLCSEDDPRDANYRALEENRERLEGVRLKSGGRLEVIRLPMPAPVVFEGMRLPASYANFLVANHAVLVPTFNDPQDRHALGILAEAFPGRVVRGIHAVDLVWGLGTLHCLSHEIPAALTGQA